MSDDENDDEVESEPIEAEVVDAPPPRQCPKCESYDVGPGKRFSAYAVVMISAFGVAIVAEQPQFGAFVVFAALAAYVATPPMRCRDCGARFD